jgi:hypothetical protein
MTTDVELKSKSQITRKPVILVALLVVIVLSLLLAVFIFMMDSDVASLDGVIHVSNEKELVKAVTNVAEPTIIILNENIVLTKSLVIPALSEITLTSSNDANNFFKLIGADGQDTITVIAD